MWGGTWTNRFSVVGTSHVTVTAAKARDHRAKVSGTIAEAFPGKVRLTDACPDKRARTTFVSVENGRWSRMVIAKRGCRIDAAVATPPGMGGLEGLRTRQVAAVYTGRRCAPTGSNATRPGPARHEATSSGFRRVRAFGRPLLPPGDG